MDAQAAVGAAHGQRLAVGGDQHIRQRRAERGEAGQHDQRRAAPAQRALEQAQHHQARGDRQQRSDAEGRHMPDRARQVRHPERHRDHPVDALPHQPPQHAVEAERDGDQRQQARRHHPDRDHRHGEEIGDHAIGRQPVEMEGGVGRGGQPGHQRRQDQPGDLAPAPQRHARAERGVGTGTPRQPILIGRDQRQRRRKRHLEARMHDRLRREQQHGEGRDRERPQRQRRPVGHHADQDDGGHDEGALGRDLGARQQQIEERRHQRAGRGPFLDRPGAGEARDQRQQRAQHEEHHARHHRHVIAGDRQHVGEA